MDEGVLQKIAEQMELDKYVKKLKILPFVKLFTYAQLKQISSLTDNRSSLRSSTQLVHLTKTFWIQHI